MTELYPDTPEDHESLLLCGFINGWSNGFAAPFFGTKANPNNWFEAYYEERGDEGRIVNGFRRANVESVNKLDKSLHRSVQKGDAEHFIVLSDGKPLVGKQIELFNRLIDKDAELQNLSDLTKADICLDYSFDEWLAHITAATANISKLHHEKLFGSWIDAILIPRIERTLFAFSPGGARVEQVRPGDILILTSGSEARDKVQILRSALDPILNSVFPPVDGSEMVYIVGLPEFMRRNRLRTISELSDSTTLSRSTVRRASGGQPIMRVTAQRFASDLQRHFGSLQPVQIVRDINNTSPQD